MLASMENRLRRWLYRRDLAVWHAPEYRWPLSALEARTGAQPRRSDFTIWFLLERRALARANLRRPRRAEYEELARVHTPELLDSLGQAETLARIFSVDPTDVPVDETMNTVRLACGGTIAAAREVLSGLNPRPAGRCALNLLGGFHHARPDGEASSKNRSAGSCLRSGRRARGFLHVRSRSPTCAPAGSARRKQEGARDYLTLGRMIPSESWDGWRTRSGRCAGWRDTE